MKRSLLIILIAAVSNLTTAQVKVGQPVPHLEFETLLNSPFKQINVDKLKGKVIWLEFWAPWCSPCVKVMPHLQELQKKYKNQLQVITITTEKQTRVKQFLSNRPSSLWFCIDTTDSFRKSFPYSIIPHSVLIDQAGNVVATTSPENVTEQTIIDLIAGKKINLPLKEDDLVNDPWTAYFSVAPVTQRRFIIQPEIKGQASGYKTYLNDSAFENRRVTMLNVPLENAYRIAYGDLSYGRIVDLTAKNHVVENKKMYCIDLIVPSGHEQDLMPTLRKGLKAHFDLRASIEKRRRMVYVLTIADRNKIKQMKNGTAKGEVFSANHGSFHGQDIRLEKIADYLESFGLVNLPVVDDTNNRNRYDIDFTYMPEKKGDLQNALVNLGLKLKKEYRDIDMLIFR